MCEFPLPVAMNYYNRYTRLDIDNWKPSNKF